MVPRARIRRLRRNAAIKSTASGATPRAQRDLAIPADPSNGDEERYPNKIGTFTKGLPHNQLGEVDLNAYNAVIRAMSSGSPADMENIPMGWPDPAKQRKLVDPQAGLAFSLEGSDPQVFPFPAPPAFDSAEEAGELVELYWHALLRDVPFTQYDSHPLVQAACDDLSKLSDFRGPKIDGRVTPATLFRDTAPGILAGPHVSQFLLKPVPFGTQFMEQPIRTYLSGVDYVTDYATWLDIQNGWNPPGPRFEAQRYFVRNGRDLARWVHKDVFFEAYLNACQIMITAPDASDETTGGGIGAPLDAANPYRGSHTQQGNATFGAAHIQSLVSSVVIQALKAAWYFKWFVHRRLRPEAFAGAAHNRITKNVNYAIHPDALNAAAATRIFSKYGGYLLPQAFPEGSPLHPSYACGHAACAGACITVLKAFFDESFVIANPVVPAADGLSLVPYTGPDADRLTVGGELNKLGLNMAMGRAFSGIHWRSDTVDCMRLGEAVAVSVLRDQRATFHEDFEGFSLTTLDGAKITV